MNINEHTIKINSVIDYCELINSEIKKISRPTNILTYSIKVDEWTPGIFSDLEKKIDQLRMHINNLGNDDIITFKGELIKKNVFTSLEVIMPILNQYKGSIEATKNSDKINGVLKQTAFYSITTLVSKQVNAIKKEAELKLKQIDPSYEIKKEEKTEDCILF